MHHYYVITYEIKSKQSHQVLEENSAIHQSLPQHFSLRKLKATLLETHGFNSNDNYVHIEGVFDLGQHTSQSSSSWSVLGE